MNLILFASFFLMGPI